MKPSEEPRSVSRAINQLQPDEHSEVSQASPLCWPGGWFSLSQEALGGGQGCSPAAAVPGHSPVAWAGAMPQVSSRGCAAGWAFSAESVGLAYQAPSPTVHGFALRRPVALQAISRLQSAFVLVE